MKTGANFIYARERFHLRFHLVRPPKGLKGTASTSKASVEIGEFLIR